MKFTKVKFKKAWGIENIDFKRVEDDPQKPWLSFTFTHEDALENFITRLPSLRLTLQKEILCTGFVFGISKRESEEKVIIDWENKKLEVFFNEMYCNTPQEPIPDNCIIDLDTGEYSDISNIRLHPSPKPAPLSLST